MDYGEYYLTDNPFPQNAVVDVPSEDIRINGTIFFQDVAADALSKLRQNLYSKTNMSYVAGLQFARGVGKSAVISHIWREIKKDERFYSLLIRCTESAPNNRPSGFSAEIMDELHRQGYLWRAFWGLMVQFALERNSPGFSKESIELIMSAHPEPIDRLSFTLYTHVSNTARFAKESAIWLQKKCRCSEHFSSAICLAYITEPNSFPKKVASGKKSDAIDLFGDVLLFMQAAKFEWGYIFLDQTEDSIMSTPTSKLGEFGTGIRRMLEKSSGKASLVVTLHPDSEQKLNSNPVSQNLQTLAPIDNKRLIALNVLDRRSELAVNLAAEYMKHFRKEDPPTKTFPLEPLVIRYVCYLKEGNIRHILQQLHECIEVGIRHNQRTIGIDFIKSNHNETMGTELSPEIFDEFERLVI